MSEENEQAEQAFVKDYPVRLAREFMAGEIIKAATEQLKHMGEPWTHLIQSEQDRILASMRDTVCKTIRRAVQIIASDARTNFVADLESVTFKDGVKCVLKMGHTEFASLLANMTGASVRIVINDESQYLGLEDAMKTNPDQADLVEALNSVEEEVAESSGEEVADSAEGDTDQVAIVQPSQVVDEPPQRKPDVRTYPKIARH